MKNWTLYRLTRRVLRVLDKIVDAFIEEGPLDTDDPLYQELDALYSTRNRKLQGYVRIIKSAKPLADAYRAEAELFSKRARAIENIAKRLQHNLIYDMQIHGEETVVAGNFKIAIRTSESVKLLVPAEDLPAEFQNVTVSADKMGIKRALKAGDEIDGVEIQKGQYVVFLIK